MPDDLEREVRDLARRVAHLEQLLQVKVGQVGQAVPPNAT
jgi:hypothetical protein